MEVAVQHLRSSAEQTTPSPRARAARGTKEEVEEEEEGPAQALGRDATEPGRCQAMFAFLTAASFTQTHRDTAQASASSSQLQRGGKQ